MHQTRRLFLAACMSATLLGAVASCTSTEPREVVSADLPDDDPPADDPHGWPRIFSAEGIHFTVYQPQIEKWDGARLLARSAVAVERAASPQPAFGTVWFVARTHVAKEERLVTLDGFAVPRAEFPTASEQTDAWLGIIRAHFPDHVKTIDLDRLESSYAALEATQRAASMPLKNDPPRILFSSRPAILLLVDGQPVLRRMPGTKLLRVINTRALLVQDESSGRFYLGLASRWLEAPAIDGPWTLAAQTPEGLDEARRAATSDKRVDLHAEDAEITALLDAGSAPTIFASTQPAELIETRGEPELAAVDGTDLLWVRNTDANVFVNTKSSEWFVLVSGRWFGAPSRSGPWRYVPGRELPADFAKIPPTHPAGEVLASIPGTPQAQEALVANEIPQTATVDRREARLDVTYDGDPRFQPVEGTALRYAVNSATPVIQVGDRFYACEDGIWFVAPTPSGPWAVADSVPAEVYSIPASCPVHYVTYVRIYDATPDVVYVGYTPGYFGACVFDGCVVWGTGWWYRPWCGVSWFGCPWTYGFGIGFRWNAWWGWNFGIGIGARPPCRPWWGPLRRPHPAFYPSGYGAHFNVGNANIYRAWPATTVRPHAIAPAVVRTPPPARPFPRNNVYSTPDGQLYRHTESGWERRQGDTWQRPAPNAQERLRAQQLDRERQIRERGTQRSQNLRREPAPPVQHYRPLGPQHPSPPTAPPPHVVPRPAPTPVPSGLRGWGPRGGGGGGTRGGHVH